MRELRSTLNEGGPLVLVLYTGEYSRVGGPLNVGGALLVHVIYTNEAKCDGGPLNERGAPVRVLYTEEDAWVGGP